MRQIHTYAAVAAIALSVLTVSAAWSEADARGRRVQGSVQTQRGVYTGSAETHRARGERTRQSTVTGPNGNTRSTEDRRNWSRAEGTYNRDRTTTYRDGSQRAVDVDAQRTGEGAYTASRTVTGRDGETRTQTGDFTRTQTEDGRSVTGDIQTSNAGQIDYSRNVSRDNSVRSVDSSATFEDGTSRTRTSSANCADQTCASNSVITRRDGSQTSWEQSRTRTENGAEHDRTVTYSDGTTRTVEGERVGNGDGAGTVTRTVTGRNGQTRTQTGGYEVTRTP